MSGENFKGDAEKLMVIIDWDLPYVKFREQIKDIITTCKTEGKVIPLPFPDDDYLATLIFLSLLDCEGCGAQCCKVDNASNNQVCLLPHEYQSLKDKYGPKGMGECSLALPCKFLTNDRCQLHDTLEKPIACFAYPIQPGGSIPSEVTVRKRVLALSSACPWSRQAALKVFTMLWRRRHMRASLTAHGITPENIEERR